MKSTDAIGIPFCNEPLSYGIDGNLMQDYYLSHRANIDCAEKIGYVIRENYNHENYTLDIKNVYETIVKYFTTDRIEYVLANTVRNNFFDGRISTDNKQWAANIPFFSEIDVRGNDHTQEYIVDSVHPGLLDLFVTYFREQQQKESPNWCCVAVTCYKNKRKKAAIVDIKNSVTRPECKIKRMSDKTTYWNWYQKNEAMYVVDCIKANENIRHANDVLR